MSRVVPAGWTEVGGKIKNKTCDGLLQLSARSLSYLAYTTHTTMKMLWPQHYHHRSQPPRSHPPPTRRRKGIILSLFTIGFFLGMTFFSHHQQLFLETTPDDHHQQLVQLSSSSSSSSLSLLTNHNNNNVGNVKKKKISYVTSFWAKQKHSTKVIPHRREIEAALLANIYNPHVDQVVVFLDGVDNIDTRSNKDAEEKEEESCAQFRQDMEELSRQFLEMSSSQHNNIVVAAVHPMLSKLTCVPTLTGQPTYHQMFLNTLSNMVTGDIIILANADMAFDDSISIARKLKEDVLVVLGTRGFSSDGMPVMTREFYDVIMMGTNNNVNIQQEQQQGRKDWDVDQCTKNPWSWDTWIYHKQRIQWNIKLQEEEHFFQRPTRTNNVMAPFFMNENGAENAALWAMEQSTNFTVTYNACDVIHSWSFHLTPRTHRTAGHLLWPQEEDNANNGGNMNRNKVYIPKPWGGSKVRPKFNGVRVDSPPYPPKWCESSNGCFFD